jgi:hypothetical protein
LPEIVFAKIAPIGSDHLFVLGRCARMVGAQTSRFDWLGHTVSARMALTRLCGPSRGMIESAAGGRIA